MGSYPNKIKNYLRLRVPKYKICYSLNELKSVVKQGGIIIFSAWNDRSNIFKGLHTIAIYYTGSSFIAYNYEYTPNGVNPKQVYFLDELFPNGKFIIAYYIQGRVSI